MSTSATVGFGGLDSAESITSPQNQANYVTFTHLDSPEVESFTPHGRFHVRELLHLDDAIVALLPPRHYLTMDDGVEIVSTRNDTRYSHLFWRIFRAYPGTPITSDHHVQAVLKGKLLADDTHRKLCSKILRSIVYHEKLFLPRQKEPLQALIYATISYAMNQVSLFSERSVTSLDATDFVQLARHPAARKLRAEAAADPDKIAAVYEQNIENIKTFPEFKNNGLAKAVRAGMVKNNQVNQCVLLRGFPSEVDGSIFSRPIWSCYTLGNTQLYDFVSDGRTAAKSHYYSDTALKESEYMARKFQLFVGAVEHIIHVDCGSTQLVPWLVEKEVFDKEGALIYPGDLPMLVGKYYREHEGEPLKAIQGDEKHLIGKTIHLRTVLHCKTPNPHHVCHVCAGQLSENISRFDNIGHLGSISTTKDLTQNILSIKHVNTSAIMVKIALAEYERNYLNTGPEGTAFFLNKSLKNFQPRLVIKRDEAPGLVDLEEIETVDYISLGRISELSAVQLVLHDKATGRDMPVVLNVKQKTRCSNMSRELLAYLKDSAWSTDEGNDFVFDMSGWNFNRPLLVMPNKEESFVDLAAAVDAMVRANLKMLNQRLIKDAPAILLQDLFNLVNSKLRINILALEIIVYALMVESTTSYAMARNAENPVLGVAELLTYHRSLGNALAYESMSKTLTNPFSFFQGRRPDSPMDVFIAPREVVDEYDGKEIE